MTKRARNPPRQAPRSSAKTYFRIVSLTQRLGHSYSGRHSKSLVMTKASQAGRERAQLHAGSRQPKQHGLPR
jgi:hypothetical protein